MTVQRFDEVPIRARRTGEGFIEDTPVLTHTGMFSYRDPSTGRERPPARLADGLCRCTACRKSPRRKRALFLS